MQFKNALRGGVAIAALFAVAHAGAADAATKSKTHKKVVHHATKTVVHTDSGMASELHLLREQVLALQARLDAQSAAQAQTQAQVASAQAQAAQAQTQAAQAQSVVQTAQAQIETIPTQVNTAVAAAKPKTDKIYYKGVSVTLGGFLEAASIYRDHSLTNDIASSFNSIPYDNTRTGHEDETRFSARQSRLSLLVQGDANPSTHIAMYGEFDFQGAAQTANSNESNSYNPRIRNLYATIDWDNFAEGMGLHLLAGQNWSLTTLNSKGITPRNEQLPPQIDAQYIPGFVWTRQPQFRITGDFMNHSLWLAASVENPQTTFYTTGTPAGATAGTAGTAASLPGSLAYNATGGSGFNSANTLSLNHLPDVVAKAAYETNIYGRGVHAEVFGLGRAFSARVNGADEDVYGGGVGFGLAGALWPKVLDAQVTGMAGHGVGRYGTSQLPDVTFDPNGRIKPLTEVMLLAGGTWHATPMLDIYAFAGEEHVEREYYRTAAGLAYGYGNPLYTNAGCETEGSSVCVGNTKLIDQATFGFWQKVYQGAFGRVQFGAQYSYTERKAYSGVGGAPGQNENMLFTSIRYYPF